MIFAADAASPAGWAHLVGLLVALAVGALAVGAHQWWLDGMPSPTPPWARGNALPPGETDDTDPDDTGFDTADDPPAGGRRVVTLPDGTRVVRYVSHIIDDPGEDEEEEESREEMADRLDALIRQGRCRYSDAVAEIMNAFDCSESTAKRALAEAKTRQARRS